MGKHKTLSQIERFITEEALEQTELFGDYKFKLYPFVKTYKVSKKRVLDVLDNMVSLGVLVPLNGSKRTYIYIQ